jgi:hypothetical protein
MTTSPVSATSAAATAPQSTAVVAGISRTRTADITLTTKDGDTVTISASQTTAVGVAGTSDGSKDQSALVKSSSSSLSVTVDGSLDARELRDIKQVVNALAHAGRAQQNRGVAHRFGRHHGHRHHGNDQASLSTIDSLLTSLTTSVAVIGGALVLGSAQDAAPAATDATTADTTASTDAPVTDAQASTPTVETPDQTTPDSPSAAA